MIVGENPWFVAPRGVATRWASPENPGAEQGRGGTTNGGRKGSAWFPLPAGERRILAESAGRPGIVRRIWMTVSDRSPRMLRGLRLDIFWDGAKRPAVRAPLGDFFGIGLGRTAPFQSALFASPEGKSFVGLAPMPFRRSMRLVLVNESGIDLEHCYYDVDFTVGDRLPPGSLYFHAHFRRENPTTIRRDYEILPRIRGRGRFLGCNIGVIADRARYGRSWWGEGEIKIHLDGDRSHPTLCGTGTEDYIGTGWGQGRFDHLYSGCSIADGKRMEYCFYRYHIPDPVYFRRDARVTIQQIGCWSPGTKSLLSRSKAKIVPAGTGSRPVDFAAKALPKYGLFERQDDWSSCAYFYLDRPENDLASHHGEESRWKG